MESRRELSCRELECVLEYGSNERGPDEDCMSDRATNARLEPWWLLDPDLDDLDAVESRRLDEWPEFESRRLDPCDEESYRLLDRLPVARPVNSLRRSISAGELDWIEDL